MKTQNTNKLAFAKNSLVELNDNQLQDVKGGSLVASLVLTVIVVATIVAAD